jgi:glycosyltransferase involved in cell wall biosynthesis
MASAPGLQMTFWVRPSAGLKAPLKEAGAQVVEVSRPAPALLRGFKALNAVAKNIDRSPDLDLFLAEALPLPRMRTKPLVATLHDLRYLKPGFSSLAHRIYGRWILAGNLDRARVIVTVSQAMKKEMIQAFPRIEAQRIEVVSNGVPPLASISSERIAELLAGLNIEKPFLLCLGHLEPRKNIKRLLQGFALLKRTQPDASRFRLVLAGSPHSGCTTERVMTWGMEAGLIRERDFHVICPVNDEARSALLRAALLAIQPSLYEGFGMGILEALAHEIPVACSRIPAHEEVAGNAAFYFDPRSIEEIAESLGQGATDEQGRNERIANGMEQSIKFSWENSAACLEKIWQRALDRQNSS